MWGLWRAPDKESYALEIHTVTSKQAVIYIYVFLVLTANVFHPLAWPAKEYLIPLYPSLCFLVAFFIFSFRNKKYHGKSLRSISYVLLALVLFSCYQLSFGQYRTNKWVKNVTRFYNERHSKGAAEALPIHWQVTHFYNSFIECAAFHQQHQRNVSYFTSIDGIKDMYIDRIYAFVKYNYLYFDTIDFDSLQHPYRGLLLITLGSFVGDGVHKYNFDKLADINKRESPYVLYHLHRGIAKSLCTHLFSDLSDYFLEGDIDAYVPLRYRHYYYHNFGIRIAEKYENDIARGIEFIRQLPKNVQDHALRGFACMLQDHAIQFILNDPGSDLTPQEYRHFWKRYGENFKARDPHWQEKVRDMPDAGRKYVISGVYKNIAEGILLIEGLKPASFDIAGYEWRRKEITAFEHCANYERVDERLVPYVYQAIGEQLCDISLGELSEDLRDYLQKKATPDVLRDVYKGYGKGLTRLFALNRPFVIQYIETYVPAEYQSDALDGWHEESRAF
jgi:hypothetical protein